MSTKKRLIAAAVCVVGVGTTATVSSAFNIPSVALVPQLQSVSRSWFRSPEVVLRHRSTFGAATLTFHSCSWPIHSTPPAAAPDSDGVFGDAILEGTSPKAIRLRKQVQTIINDLGNTSPIILYGPSGSGSKTSIAEGTISSDDD